MAEQGLTEGLSGLCANMNQLATVIILAEIGGALFIVAIAYLIYKKYNETKKTQMLIGFIAMLITAALLGLFGIMSLLKSMNPAFAC